MLMNKIKKPISVVAANAVKKNVINTAITMLLKYGVHTTEV